FGLRYTAPPSCHTLPLHDALPIWLDARSIPAVAPVFDAALGVVGTERFWAALGGTLQSWGLGMLIASAVGISLGMIIGASPLLTRLTGGLIDFPRTVPATLPVSPVRPASAARSGSGPLSAARCSPGGWACSSPRRSGSAWA